MAKAHELAVKAIEERKQKERQEEFERLAREAQGDRMYFVNADRLGTPQEVVSEDGKVVWLARYKAWGRIHRLDVNDIVQPLRFQGQYEDEETGLYYNRYRYYDPDTARYLTQDPIGLLGGTNLHQYAPNPILWVDPLGLSRRKKKGEGKNEAATCPRLASNLKVIRPGTKEWEDAVSTIKKGGNSDFRVGSRLEATALLTQARNGMKSIQPTMSLVPEMFIGKVMNITLMR